MVGSASSARTWCARIGASILVGTLVNTTGFSAVARDADVTSLSFIQKTLAVPSNPTHEQNTP
jgi:hypothetical protein